MSDTNETDRMNERRRNMGLPPITARASKPTRQLTTEDIREYLEEIKAIAEKLFPNEIDRDTYIKSARSKVKEELLAEKVQLTDDDQILILDKITGKVKTTKIDNVKSKPTTKDFFKDKSQDLSKASPEVLKLIDLIKNDKTKSNRDRILDNIRAGKNVEKLETLSTSFESLLREQQTTIKLLNELKNKIVGSSATGGATGGGGGNNRNRGRGGVGSSILRGIVNNPGIAILGGIGVARAVGGIVSGSGTEPSPSPQAEEAIARGAGGPRVQAQNPQGELNEELRSMVREGQLTREQANSISIRSLTGEITPEEAREEARSLVQTTSGTVPPPANAPANAPTSNNVPAVVETEEQIYNRLLAETPENMRGDVDVQNDLRSEAGLISRRNRQPASGTVPPPPPPASAPAPSNNNIPASATTPISTSDPTAARVTPSIANTSVATPIPQAQNTRPESGSFRSAGTAGNLSVEYRRTADGKHYINSREVDAQTYDRFRRLTSGSDARRDPRYQQYIRESIANGDDFALNIKAENRIQAEDRAELANLIRTVELQPQVSIPTPAATPAATPVPQPASTPAATPDASGPEGSDVDGLGLRPTATVQPAVTPRITSQRSASTPGEGADLAVGFAGGADASSMGLTQQTPAGSATATRIATDSLISSNQVVMPALAPSPRGDTPFQRNTPISGAERRERDEARHADAVGYDIQHHPANIAYEMSVRTGRLELDKQYLADILDLNIGEIAGATYLPNGDLSGAVLSNGENRILSGRDMETFQRAREEQSRQQEFASRTQSATPVQTSATTLPPAATPDASGPEGNDIDGLGLRPAAVVPSAIATPAQPPTPVTPRISAGGSSRITSQRRASTPGEGADLAAGFAGSADATSMGLEPAPEQRERPRTIADAQRLWPTGHVEELSVLVRSRLNMAGQPERFEEVMEAMIRLNPGGLSRSGLLNQSILRDYLTANPGRRTESNELLEQAGRAITQGGQETQQLLDSSTSAAASATATPVPPVPAAAPAATPVVSVRDFGREYGMATEARAKAEQLLASFRETAGPTRVREGRNLLPETYYEDEEVNAQFKELENNAVSARAQEKRIREQNQSFALGLPNNVRFQEEISTGRGEGRGPYAVYNRMLETLKSRFNYTDEQIFQLSNQSEFNLGTIGYKGRRISAHAIRSLFERHMNEDLVRSAHDSALQDQGDAAAVPTPSLAPLPAIPVAQEPVSTTTHTTVPSSTPVTPASTPVNADRVRQEAFNTAAQQYQNSIQEKERIAAERAAFEEKYGQADTERTIAPEPGSGVSFRPYQARAYSDPEAQRQYLDLNRRASISQRQEREAISSATNNVTGMRPGSRPGLGGGASDVTPEMISALVTRYGYTTEQLQSYGGGPTRNNFVEINGIRYSFAVRRLFNEELKKELAQRTTTPEEPTATPVTPATTRSIAMATNPVAAPQVQTTTPSVDAAIVPAEPAATPSSIRTLEASNISRREYFDQTDNNATAASGFELANDTPAAELTDSNLISANALSNIANTNIQPVSLARDPVTPNALERNIAKDDDVVVNEAVREAELLAREYESNPDLFSNRNLVLRARKVTFSGDSIEFKLPSIDATMFQPASPGAPNPLNIPASMLASTGQAIAREPAMSTTPAAVSMGAAAGAASSTRLIRPTSGRVTSPFGMRSMGDHRGIDYGVPVGTPVVAAHSGTIVEVRESSSYGNMIRIRGDDGMDTLYAHLSTFGVQQGQQVIAGQQIALSGNTGRSTGPHLHFEVIRNGNKIDPAPLLGLSGAEATQRSEGQTPEPSPLESDASPVASTPATAAASVTPSAEPTTPAAQMLSVPASDGAAVDGASRDNAIAERSPAAAAAPSVIDMSSGSSNPSTPPPAYNSSNPNDPGLVEPEDAAERYARLFDMAA